MSSKKTVPWFASGVLIGACSPIGVARFSFFVHISCLHKNFKPFTDTTATIFILSGKNYRRFSPQSIFERSIIVGLGTTFFILSFCRSVKESIKESATYRVKRRQILKTVSAVIFIANYNVIIFVSPRFRQTSASLSYPKISSNLVSL